MGREHSWATAASFVIGKHSSAASGITVQGERAAATTGTLKLGGAGISTLSFQVIFYEAFIVV
jgi:hypothetical protein